MFHFCTYFDQYYLVKGVALLNSLHAHSSEFTLYVLCFDDESFEALRALGDPACRPISVHEFEAADPATAGVRALRSRLEYYFSCTPALPLFILKNYPDVDVVTYLDADLFFFSSLLPVMERTSLCSILVVGLRHPDSWTDASEKYGRYNVGFISWRNDEHGRACLEWWRLRCIEWCFDRIENDLFADQKYLDQWPLLFQRVHELDLKGANLAFWNWDRYLIQFLGGEGTVDGEPIMFCHMSRVRHIWRCLYLLNFDHPFRVPPTIRKGCFVPYVEALVRAERLLSSRGVRVKAVGDLRSKPGDWWRILQSLSLGNFILRR